MKKIIAFAFIALSITGCKKVCYNCVDGFGQGRGEKCFNTKNEREEYKQAQYHITSYSDQCK